MGQLTKRAKCWYHDDRHPSMHVNKKKNICKCFVCGKGGDVIRLLQDYENLSFVEACDWLVHEFSVVTNTNLTNPTNHSCNSCSKDQSVSSESSVVEDKSSTISPLPSALVTKSLGVNSEFCQALVRAGYMTQQQMQHAAERYRLGAAKDGSVIFWEIDQHGHCHNGKLMHYLPDCHRNKQQTPTWAIAELKKSGILPPDFNNPHCLFGEHLLTNTNFTNPTNHSCYSCSGKTVCVVESEKTAVILSEHFPQSLWFSCGGLQMFKPQLLAPLVNHKVVIFPDTDERGDAFNAWSAIAREAQKLYPFRFPLRISSLLEEKATAEQKQRKIDLVDFLFEYAQYLNVSRTN